MGLLQWYWPLLYTHVTCVILSGSLFFTRGCLMLADCRLAGNPYVKRLSYVIDTTLLVAAIGLAIALRQYPFVHAWLTVKVLLLVVYIVLGVFALRLGRTRRSRLIYFVTALLVFLFIVSVARSHNPLGALLWLG